MKKETKTTAQPRFVVYASPEEVAKGNVKAKQAGVKGHNKWAGIVLRKELAK